SSRGNSDIAEWAGKPKRRGKPSAVATSVRGHDADPAGLGASPVCERSRIVERGAWAAGEAHAPAARSVGQNQDVATVTVNPLGGAQETATSCERIEYTLHISGDRRLASSATPGP